VIQAILICMHNVTARFRPFDLSDDAAYRAWRGWKLDGSRPSHGEAPVPVRDLSRLTGTEYQAILQRVRKSNLAIYQVTGAQTVGKSDIRALGRRFGLESLDMNLRADEDSITTITVQPDPGGTQYIPYTDKPLNWHTDGYYNRPEEQVRAIIMHCVAAAASGGENLFLDPEIAYLRLRDENPDFVRALMQPDVMTIPANVEQGSEIRATQSGPVFSLENGMHALHMRYTARTRSILWKDDPVTRNAIEFLRELLNSDSPWLIRHRLQAGQGIICNNVLHRREAFADDAGHKRVLYRARYHERIHATVAGPDCYGERNALVE
jgi:alpha-ketoglutarate-dependent taurine dioxygenase